MAKRFHCMLAERTLYVRGDGFEPREPDKAQDFTKAVKLDHGLDSVRALCAAPRRIGQAARVKVRVDGTSSP
jgi:hypothetical protein